MNMIMDTDLGKITISLFPEMAPKAIKRLGEVIELGLMKNITLERLEPGFVIQPLFFDGVNEEIDVMVEPEFLTVAANHEYRFKRGTVAMAGDAEHASGSQFFISLAAAERLNGKFTVIGEVVGGSDVVDTIDALPVVSEIDEASGFTYHRPEKAFVVSVRME